MTNARLWHPLRINRALRVMLHTHWSAEAWSQVRVEFRRAPRPAERDLDVRGGLTRSLFATYRADAVSLMDA